MPAVSGELPSLIQGVSQQPAAIRRESQSEAELNSLPSAVEGNIKRPPTELISTLVASGVGLPFIHWNERDASVRTVTVLTADTLNVYDALTGSQLATFPIGAAHPLYDASADLRDKFVATTIADTTFIARKSTVVATRVDTAPTRNFEAVINVKAGNFGRTYSVNIDGTVTSFQTRDGGTASDTLVTGTDHIANVLMTAPADPSVTGPGLDSYAGITATRDGSVIHLSSATDFTITVDDGQGGSAMTVVKDTVQNFSDLPRDVPVDGYTVQIVGDNGSTIDDWFVRYDLAKKAWVETIQPGSLLGLDPATMPYVLTRLTNGTYTLTAGPWQDRSVGSEQSAEDPDFVGKTISAIGFTDGRLAIGYEDGAFWSIAKDIYSFYPQTVTQVLDDAPFGVENTAKDVVVINSIFEYAERIYLNSNKAQFRLLTDGVLEAGSNQLLRVSKIRTQSLVEPILTGDNLLLSSSRGKFSGIRRVIVDEVTGGTRGEDVTEHVPKFIPSDVISFFASDPEQTVFMQSRTEANRLYIWRYIENDAGNLVQSAFVPWEFDVDTVLSGISYDTDVYLLMIRGGALSLHRLDMSPAATDPDQAFRHHLDWRVTEAECTITYDPVEDQSTITHPVASFGTFTVASRGGDADVVGERADIVSSTGSQIVVEGDWTARLFYAGKDYTHIYEFTPIYKRDSQTGAADQSGRLQVRKFRVDFEDTGFFQIEVTPLGRGPYIQTFEGRIFDSPASIYDDVALEDGTLSTGVMGEGPKAKIRLLNDSFLPARFLRAGWEGSFNPRARRIS